jgi:predicted MPP superfamily phosphohydrolase
VAVPALPESFAGKTIAVLTDSHHGPFIGLEFIEEVVALANSLRPDAFALVGDFAHKGGAGCRTTPPRLQAMAKLEAPLGVFSVPGNHDMLRGGKVYQEAVRQTPITDLTNRSV